MLRAPVKPERLRWAAFWEWLVEKGATGWVRSVEKVGDEVLAVDDELSEWARERGATFFVPPDETVVP